MFQLALCSKGNSPSPVHSLLSQNVAKCHKKYIAKREFGFSTTCSVRFDCSGFIIIPRKFLVNRGARSELSRCVPSVVVRAVVGEGAPRNDPVVPKAVEHSAPTTTFLGCFSVHFISPFLSLFIDSFVSRTALVVGRAPPPPLPSRPRDVGESRQLRDGLGARLVAVSSSLATLSSRRDCDKRFSKRTKRVAERKNRKSRYQSSWSVQRTLRTHEQMTADNSCR